MDYSGWRCPEPLPLPTDDARQHAGAGVVCELCRHEAVMNVDRFGDAVPVPAFGPRMVCTSLARTRARTGWSARDTRA